MTHIMVRHRVGNYDTWKKAFDNFADFRRTSGEKSYLIYQPEDDADNLYLMFEWDTPAHARKFFESSELKSTMQKAGVKETPEIRFLNESASGKL